MHFFHPIQQSAQQIYYTALPLSPTSSYLQNSCLQNVAEDQLSHVTTFIGAPDTWGLLLRTIDTRPGELTYITTSGQGIIAACGDIVNIYNVVTGVLQQSLSPPETVTKIQASPYGSTLFFAHSFSVTMWSVQTSRLIHTFAAKSEVNDIAVSTSGDHIACGSSNGSVAFWNVHTKEEGKAFGDGEPVVTICWLSPQELAVATQNSLYVHDIATSETLDRLPIPGRVWGMVYFEDRNEFLLGTSQSSSGTEQALCSLEIISHRRPESLEKRRSTTHRGWFARRKIRREKQSQTYPGQLTRPTLVGKNIACMTLPTGVQSFDTCSYDWTNNPSLLEAAASVAVSLNRNLVAQTKDSIQIFSIDVLTSGGARNDTCVSHVYPLGENHIICVLQPTRNIAILELETLRELRCDDEALPFWLLPLDETESVRAPLPPFAGQFDIPMAVRAWRLGTSIPEQIVLPDENTPRLLYGLSPACTKIATLHDPPQRELQVNDTKRGDVLAHILLKDDDLGGGEVYGLIFDSETRFYLEADGPDQHVQIPYDITPPPSDELPHTIAKGEQMPLSEPRAPPPYTLDADCEWVLDTQSRKICWISPGNLRRGNGGHFWAGPSLVMVGGDGVVRKVSFREPDR